VPLWQQASRLGRLVGIDRPAIGAVFPLVASKPVLVLDVRMLIVVPSFGAVCRHGTIYSQYVLGIPEPQVGSLNIGEEASKGNDSAVRTHQMLQKHPRVSFIGNAEGRDVLSGRFDVIVCDGFVGNVLLKFAEVGDSATNPAGGVPQVPLGTFVETKPEAG